MDEEELHEKVNQSVDPLRQEVQDQVDQAVKDARNEEDRPEETNLQKAIHRTIKALKQTLQWLARTLRALLKTVVALLKAVVNLVILLLLALFEGLKSLGGSLGEGAKKLGGNIMDGIKNMLVSSGAGLLEKMLPGGDSKDDAKEEEAAA
jgi:hypothetical protein